MELKPSPWPALLRPVDFVFLARPVLFIMGWTFAFLGFYWGAALTPLGLTTRLPLSFALRLLSYTLLMGCVYVINQIFDVESDRRNDKLFLLPRRIISLRAAWIYAACLCLVSALTALTQSGTFLLLWGVSLALGLAYSVPPLLFKGRPVLDVLSNSLGYGMVNFLVGYTVVAPVSGAAFLHSVPYVLAISAAFLNTTVPDIPGDRAAGERTTGVTLGERGTTVVALVVLLVALAAGFTLRDPFSTVTALVSLPLFALAALKPRGLFPKLAFRFGGGLFVALTALRFPPFALASVLTFIALKLYYRYRFHYDYPALLGR